MRWTADELHGFDYKLYRMNRFGDAGKSGKKGVALAAGHHGVTVRAWFMYEAGTRRPKRPVRVTIAQWLTREAKKRHASEVVDAVTPLDMPTDPPAT